MHQLINTHQQTMSTTLEILADRVAVLEKQIALLKKMMHTIAGTTIKSDASAVTPSKRTDTVAVSKRVNGYTLFLKEGGKRNQWKSVSK